MSPRKSFDVQAKRPEGKPKPARRRKRKSEPVETPRRKKSLRTRREEARGKKHTVLLTLCALAAVGVVYALWQPEIRITSVSAEETPDAAGIEAIAREHLTGAYYSVFPRNSFFLYPEREVRAAILDAYPSISSLSLHRTGFTELSITASSRSAAFLWCGTPEGAASEATSCYDTDAEGFVFAFADLSTTTEDATLLRVYATLDAASSSDTYPLRAKVEGSEQLPDILRFARALNSLGIVLRSVAIRGDEADLYSAGGTRITYVVGKEREAADIAEAAFPKLNFMDGSIDYVDLRFDGKAYVNRRE